MDETVKTVLKNHGRKAQPFDSKKIYNAIIKAMRCGSGILNRKLAKLIVEETEEKFAKKAEITTVDIDNFILNKLNSYGQNLTANSYERYKAAKEYQRKEDIIDKEVSGIIDQSNRAVLDENSNKDGRLISTQHDLIAGTYSRSYCERVLLPTHILHAHQEGLIHIHDTDYLIYDGDFNCCLFNLKEMLDHGTVINGHLIEPPKSLMTAATVASQISLQVSNGQHGGQTMSIAHLAKYVRVSREKILADELKHHPGATEAEIQAAVEDRLRQEVKAAVQTIQYQENTFSSTNGQTPFVSIFLYLRDEPEYEEETALLIEETLKLRLLGMKNADGVYVTPAFPKLLFVLDDNNVPEDSKYHYLFKLAVKCSAKRMNPDYISAKIMREQFEGNVFPCMGCVDKDEVITYSFPGMFGVEEKVTESFGKMWARLSHMFPVSKQLAEDSYYIDLKDVRIYDTDKGDFVDCKRIVRNRDKGDWKLVKLSGGRVLTCTADHPLHVKGKGRTLVSDLKVGDSVDCTFDVYTPDKESIFDNIQPYWNWVYGAWLFNGYQVHGQPYLEIDIHRFPGALDKVKTAFELGFGSNGPADIEITEIRDGVMAIKPLRYLCGGESQTFQNFSGFLGDGEGVPENILRATAKVRKQYLEGVFDCNGWKKADGDGKYFIYGFEATKDKEKALQLLHLINSLGLEGRMHVHDLSSGNEEILEYGVFFESEAEFFEDVSAETVHRHKDEDFKVEDIVDLGWRGEYSYDVTTESDRFDVSGIRSHNCRSFLNVWKDEDGNYKWYGRLTAKVEPSVNGVNVRQHGVAA